MELLFFGALGVLVGVSWLRDREAKKDMPFVRTYKGVIGIIAGLILIIAGLINIFQFDK